IGGDAQRVVAVGGLAHLVIRATENLRLRKPVGILIVDDQYKTPRSRSGAHAIFSPTARAIAWRSESRVSDDLDSTPSAADRRRRSPSVSRCDVMITTGTREVAGSRCSRSSTSKPV